MKHFKILFGFLIIAFIVVVLIYQTSGKRSETTSTTTDSGEVVNQVQHAWDQQSAKVPLSQILTGCYGQDCIPSIDDPQFSDINKADEWLQPQDRVFTLTKAGITKIYPQRILNWHEIVNDWFGDDPVAITFCPLCGSSVAFDRRVDGTITQFGVSGKLHQNDLVMYDRYEGSLWQQITGEAIVGPAARRNEELTPILLTTSTWQEAKEKHPQALVLSTDTGFSRDYSLYPYGSYQTNDQIGITDQDVDGRLHPKTWVYGVRVEDIAVAFLEEELFKKEVINYTDQGLDLTLTVDRDTVNIIDNTTGEQVIPLRLFWFAWAAFNPDTIIAS